MIKANAWLGEVEGLWGVAALWVFALHVGILCGANLPLVSSGAFGVYLFILISEFIMVHQFLQRETVELWTEASTWPLTVLVLSGLSPNRQLILTTRLNGKASSNRERHESRKFSKSDKSLAPYRQCSLSNGRSASVNPVWLNFKVCDRKVLAGKIVPHLQLESSPFETTHIVLGRKAGARKGQRSDEF